MRTPSRRRVLVTAGTGIVGLLAGCSSGERTPTTTRALPTTEPSTSDQSTSTTASTGDDDGDDTVTDAERVSIAKAMTAELASGEFDAVHERFGESLADEVSPADLSQVWSSVADQLGAYRGASTVELGTEQGFPFVLLRATFERGVLRVKVSFEADAVAGLWIRPPDGSYDPPTYADSSSVEERSVTVPSPACDLGGTLTLPAEPAADASVPGVVLVHGTGPADRDQTIGPNKPFTDLALGLSSRGVAVLRYDKRTFSCGVSRTDGLDLNDLTVDDAVVAIETLREHPAVDTVAVVGHSQGGYAAPRIAARADPAGMAGLAAPAGSLAHLVAHQVRYTAELDGELTETERERIETVEDAVARIDAGDLGSNEMLLAFHAAFWRDVSDYDPPAVAADLDLPRFLAFGGRDWQVPVERARPDWTDVLGDDSSVRFETYPDANHHFVPGEGTPTPGEYLQPGNVTEALVDDLAAWTKSLR